MSLLPAEHSPGDGPVGQGDHVVQEGECASSIAASKGLKESSILNHPDNAELFSIRDNPNVLLPKDRLTVPDIDPENFDNSVTDTKHDFQLNGEPVFLRIQIKHRDEPVAGSKFSLTVGPKVFQGVTGADGRIEVKVPPLETTGFLRVEHKGEPLTMELKLGALAPVESVRGIQQRLQNLGFDCGPIDGIIGPKTRNGIKAFQRKNGLLVDGIAGPVTRATLKQQHGC